MSIFQLHCVDFLFIPFLVFCIKKERTNTLPIGANPQILLLLLLFLLYFYVKGAKHSKQMLEHTFIIKTLTHTNKYNCMSIVFRHLTTAFDCFSACVFVCVWICEITIALCVWFFSVLFLHFSLFYPDA